MGFGLEPAGEGSVMGSALGLLTTGTGLAGRAKMDAAGTGRLGEANAATGRFGEGSDTPGRFDEGSGTTGRFGEPNATGR